MPTGDIRYSPPGHDPTGDDIPDDGPSLSGCLLKIGIVLVVVFGAGYILTSSVSKAAPAPTATPAPATATLTPTPESTQTPFVITATPAMINGTIPPPPTASKTPIPPSPTRTATFTGTPFPGELWISLQKIWPKKNAVTQSGVMWQSVANTGLICPIQWPLGSVVILEDQRQYICVDRYKTAKCTDSICVALVFSQQNINPAPIRAVIISGQVSNPPTQPNTPRK